MTSPPPLAPPDVGGTGRRREFAPCAALLLFGIRVPLLELLFLPGGRQGRPDLRRARRGAGVRGPLPRARPERAGAARPPLRPPCPVRCPGVLALTVPRARGRCGCATPSSTAFGARPARWWRSFGRTMALASRSPDAEIFVLFSRGTSAQVSRAEAKANERSAPHRHAA